MVFYRKYRPQLISELDLSSVREKLTSILSAKEIPHAFLFAGPKGLGKTSSARILAKAINCESRITTNDSPLTTNKTQKKSEVSSKKLEVASIEPCNVCSACVSITNGSAIDVLEIDAASNRGIDEIRDLKERIKFSPSQLKKKIYIIDEVHMLTPEAFNALLKTLEEPPEHVVFILATTEIGKLPSTIVSRVFLIQFEKPSKVEIARSLRRVADGEKLEIEEGALEKIGELSDGAFRDGAKILEELSLHTKGNKITMNLLETLYKTGTIDNSVEKLVALTLGKKIKDALVIIDTLTTTGSDFKQIIEKMADTLHAKLLDLIAKNKMNEITPVQKLLGLLDTAYKDIKGAVLPQLPLEIALLEFCLEQNSASSSNYPVIGIKPKTQVSVSENVMVHHSTDKPYGEPVLNQEPKPTLNQEPTTNNFSDLSKQLVEAVNLENKILAGVLRGCKIEENVNWKLILKAPSPFHQGKLKEAKNLTILEQAAGVLLGKVVAIEIKT